MFKDVQETDWYYQAIKKLQRLGLVSGYPDGTFQPKKNINRGENAAMLHRFYMAKKQLIQKLSSQVVKVMNKETGGQGSGVILDSKRKLIATNVHVILAGIDASKDLEIFLHKPQGIGFKANIRYGDFLQDIAILEVPAIPEEFLQPVTFANAVNWLDEVVCIGNALGFMHTASVGYVSFEKRSFGAAEYIQTDAAINPGNSGGGCFNLAGELIGLPTFKVVWADAAMTQPVTGVGFVTPAKFVKQYYEEVIKQERTGFKGEYLKGKMVDFIL